ncbi:MAG: carboxylating nicotinate-nucleotide diphosphorylase [Desulfonatronovibrionaceae bacterium]
MKLFSRFFTPSRLAFLDQSISLALAEDGRDLTSTAVFRKQDRLEAEIVSKEKAIVCGLPIISLVLQHIGGDISCNLMAKDGETTEPGQVVAELSGGAAKLLKAERVILNFICHLSGVASRSRQFCEKAGNFGTKILDTRKTLPGLRYPEKYAVLVGGGENHRLDLEEMLMLKDNHIDRCGGIKEAVSALRNTYSPCPPVEVECRNINEVREAVAAGADRIMLDNMRPEQIRSLLPLVPQGIETEISGNISLKNLAAYAGLGANYISIGSLTHSAPAADFSMKIKALNWQSTSRT